MKFIKTLVVSILTLSVLLVSGCSKKVTDQTTDEKSSKEIENLRIAFVPSRDVKDIAEQTEPLKGLLISELAKSGYDVKNVTISVTANYEASGEALVGGTVDVAFLPGGTYAQFSQSNPGAIKLLLSATRHGLIYDTENPKDYNTGEPNFDSDNTVTYYRGIIVAGPSEIGKAIAAKVNAGEKLVWDDIKDATWCLQSVTSGSGYQYPLLWLQNNFGKSFNDAKTVKSGGYGAAIKSLQTGQCDIAPGYNDVRFSVKKTTEKQNSTPDQWIADGGTNIWTDTQVIGVTDKIQNDTISASAANVDDELATAIKKAFINIAGTEEGKEVIKIYNHIGYSEIDDSAYDSARKINEIVKELNLGKQ